MEKGIGMKSGKSFIFAIAGVTLLAVLAPASAQEDLCEGVLVVTGPAYREKGKQYQIALPNTEQPEELTCLFNDQTEVGKLVLRTCVIDDGCRIQGVVRKVQVPQNQEGGGAVLRRLVSVTSIRFVPSKCDATSTFSNGKAQCIKRSLLSGF